MEATPFELLQLRQPTFEDECIGPILQTARQEATALKGLEAQISRDYDLTYGTGMYTPPQLLEYAAVLDEASLWQRVFGANYKRAVSAHHRIALGKKKPSRQQMSRALRSVAEYLTRRAQFETQATYRQMLGIHFHGVDSPWENLQELFGWYEHVFVAFPDHQADSEPFRRLMFEARIDRLKAIKATLGSSQEHQSIFESVSSSITKLTCVVPSQRVLLASGSFDEILDCLKQLKHELAGVIQSFDRVAIHDDVALRDVPGILNTAEQCCTAMTAVQGAGDLPVLIGSAYRGVNTDVEPVKHTL